MDRFLRLFGLAIGFISGLIIVVASQTARATCWGFGVVLGVKLFMYLFGGLY